MIEIRGTGHIYRNPKPHLRARHAWHPTLVVIDENELIAAFDIGEAVESLDYRTYISRSDDGGQTWDAPVPMLPDNLIQYPTRRTTHIGRPRRMSDGELVAFVARFYRDDPEQGIWNPDTTGLVEMDLMVARSTDDGLTWGQPQHISPPLVGQPFEVCHTIVELADDRWLAPVSCLRCWDGAAPNGLKVIGLVSADQGVTWPTYVDILDDFANGVVHFEQSVVQLADERLLAVGWGFDERIGKTKAVNYAVSQDGKTFSTPPRPTGLNGETSKLLALPDGRVVCVYRGIDPPGLCGTIAHLDGEEWRHDEPQVLWQGDRLTRMFGEATATEELRSLKLGCPNLALLPDGDVLVAFWCHEDEVYNIRWVRLVVGGFL